MKKRAIFLVLVMFLSIQLVHASDYYADIEIDVDEAGSVDISGTTNHDNLIVESSQDYTSKKQSYWLLDITFEEEFSDYVYVVNLPFGSSINYIKSAGSFRIETGNGKLSIKGYGNNKPLSIIIQYQIGKTDQNDYTSFIVALIFITMAVLFITSRVKKIKKRSKKHKEKNDHNLDGLTVRQKDIMRLLIEKDNPMTQKEIEKGLNIPKASISRNINSMELKGLIEKEKTGMTNIIKLKK
ncbi:MAG: MarR family transcriptional regulator [Nanoarchaeota archaeon]